MIVTCLLTFKMVNMQFEKQNGSTPFTQYYKSIINKAASRNFTLNQKV